MVVTRSPLHPRTLAKALTVLALTTTQHLVDAKKKGNKKKNAKPSYSEDNIPPGGANYDDILGGGGKGGLGGLGGLGGDDGYGDLFKPETNCPVFTCPKGQKPVQKGGSKKKDFPVVYGCDASSFDMMMMLDPSNLNGAKKGGTREKLWKCCVGRDIGQQTCGRTKKEIEDDFGTCTNKKCKGDKNCKMNAQFGSMMSGGISGDKCDEYNKSQAANCECVPEDDTQDSFKKALKGFYGIFAKEKLPKDGGEIDDQWMSETVYKSFKKGQEPKIWNALFTKYSSNLRHEDKPKPKYDYPPPMDEDLPDMKTSSSSADAKKNTEKPAKTSSTTTTTMPGDDDFGATLGGDEELVEDVELFTYQEIALGRVIKRSSSL
ncbi:unnamed protein product [Amoebophrya sp. A120]|nr:unnamed protein product [Amoebophrya sp. A120]|eukprot:GSA120T00022518001.1